jgi:tRNA (guanine-N7-)-methyltransferase
MSIAASSELPPLEILPGAVSGPFVFASLFGNEGPVEIEIGTGKGRFLLAQASERPDVNFLGIEWSLKYLRVAKDRAQRRGLRNLRLYRADARHVLADLVPDGSLLRVHVYCPDPWPKKRHHKRRLFLPATVTDMARVLAPGGYLDLSTDVREYYDEIMGLLSQETGLRLAEDPLFPIGSPAGRTSYETKYLLSGRPIHRATFTRASRGLRTGRAPVEVTAAPR